MSLLIDPYRFAVPTTPPALTDKIAEWWADDAVHTNVSGVERVTSWADRVAGKSLTSPTTGQRPIWLPSGIGGRPTIDYDHAASHVSKWAGLLSSSTDGTIAAVLDTDDATTAAIMWSAADEAANNRHLLGSIVSGDFRHQARNGSGTEKIVGGNGAAAANTPYLVEWSSTSTTLTVFRNGTSLTMTVYSGANDGAWFANITGIDNFVIGTRINSGGESSARFNGQLAYLVVCDTVFDSTNRETLEAWVASYYGLTIA